MVVTCLGYKGGVAKTTTAIHLAAFFQTIAPTILIDGDANRSALAWSEAGLLPFRVVDERAAVRASKGFEFIVIDTAARPETDALEALAEGCDLMVLPTTAEAMPLRALMDTADALRALGTERFRVLLTMVPPKPSKDGELARVALNEAGLPLFAGSVRRAIAFQRASLHGCLVRDVKDPRAEDGWGDYMAFGKEIMKIMRGEPL